MVLILVGNFLKENWAILLTLLVAILGGLPGILSIISEIKKRVALSFNLSTTMIGNSIDGKSILMLTGVISNKSEFPVRPNFYDLKIKLRRKWFSMERELIPSDATFQSNEQEINFNEPDKSDLQKIDQNITSRTPIRGHLMFSSKEITSDELKKSDYELKLNCQDIFGKPYKIKILGGKKEIVNEGTTYPKYGMEVRPKN